MPRLAKRPSVAWYALPDRKKPIAYSHKATSDLIVILSQEYKTVQDVYNAVNYDVDAKTVLQKYIDYGWGQKQARDLFK